MNESGAIMKPVILAEKLTQAKTYADAFSFQQQESYLDIHPSSIFPASAYITWGIGRLIELKNPKSYDCRCRKWLLDSLPIFSKAI